MSHIGHNQPPEDEGASRWKKKFFHMSVEEAEMVVKLLEAYKRSILNIMPSKAAKDLTSISDGRVKYLQKKLGVTTRSNVAIPEGK